MKWSLDSNRYISEITRKALQVIVANNITPASSSEQIVKAEHELADIGYFQDYSKAQGRIKRAVLTYFHAYGCLDDNHNVTELGRLYAENKITLKEFCFFYIVNFRYDNSYFPVHLLLLCLNLLSLENEDSAYITSADFEKLTECNSIYDIDDDFIEELLVAHKSAPCVVNERAIGFDIWSKMLVQAGICSKNSKKALVIHNRNLANWMLDSYSRVSLDGNFTHMNAGILNLIPVFDLNHNNIKRDDYLGEGKALQAYLFDDIDIDIIQKYIMISSQKSFHSMIEDLGMSYDLAGFYKDFTGYEKLVGYSLMCNPNKYIRILGEILTSTPISDFELNFQEDDYIDESNRMPGGENILYYGVPGSGKSWTIEHENYGVDVVKERVVFHPDYTNADFIGQILPVVDPISKLVTYEFVAGPFTRFLEKAYNDPQTKYIFIIEEINRGNASAIFGDVFQLLDRLDIAKDGYPIGTSCYGIRNDNMANVIYGDSDREVRIPSNMDLLATMNTSDQNVFTLDTAFQRRWQMRMVSNSFKYVDRSFANIEIVDTGVTWKHFCETINDVIVENKKRMGVSEDKRLGVYFVSESELKYDDISSLCGDTDCLIDEYDRLSLSAFSTEDKIKYQKMKKSISQSGRFAEKVLKYLWDDVFKFSHEVVFDIEKYHSCEDIIFHFMFYLNSARFDIFNESIRSRILN